MMKATTEYIQVQTKGHGDMHDITGSVEALLSRHGYRQGQILISVVGSTAGITTIEFEPGLRKDFPQIMNELIPDERNWAHHQTWGDYNGGGHLKASVLGPSLSVPFDQGRLILGTWQQIIVVDFDERPRSRKMAVSILGETE